MQYIMYAVNRCNLSCVYCYEKDRERRSKSVFDIESVKKLYDEILAYHERSGDPNILFLWLGGEPTLLNARKFRRFLEMQSTYFAKKYNVINEIQTNLVKLTPAYLDIFRDFEIKIGVSYDFTKMTRVFRNGRDASPIIERNMKLLRDSGIPFGIVCVVTSYNIDRMEYIYEFMVDNDISFSFIPCKLWLYKYQRKYLIDPRDYGRQLVKVIKRYILDKNTKIRFGNAHCYSAVVLKDYPGTPYCEFRKVNCLIDGIMVKPNGDIYPCADFTQREFFMGNCFSSSLFSILSKDNRIYKKFDRWYKTIGPSCSKCVLEPICSRGCPARAFYEGRFPKESKFYCELNKIVLPELVSFFQELGYETKI